LTIYNITGWGKGKTTSAIGIAARAIANNEKVLFAQFLKDGTDLGIRMLQSYHIDDFKHIYQGTKGFKPENCELFMDKVVQETEKNHYDLVVLDELNVALDYELLDMSRAETLIDILNSVGTDVYITGRINKHKLRHQMMDMADIATNCYCEAHNFNPKCMNCGLEFDKPYKYCPICGKKLTKSEPARKGREC
jgi:cob(I)alamin adenosyltransferase